MQVLAPEQELDRVIADGDVLLDVERLLQAAQELAVDDRGVDLLRPDLELLVGDHVQPVERVLVRALAVALGHVVDQALVERPGVHLALPVVDDGVAEPEALGLLVGHPGREPGLLRRRLGGLRRVGQEGVDGRLQPLPGGQRVVIHGRRHVAIGREHRRSADGGTGGARQPGGREQGG